MIILRKNDDGSFTSVDLNTELPCDVVAKVERLNMMVQDIFNFASDENITPELLGTFLFKGCVNAFSQAEDGREAMGRNIEGWEDHLADIKQMQIMRGGCDGRLS
ncbi:MAG: hypothetical protein JKY34_08650 [Kordiimonadaceae bacterium]|nr:hypothetical protein [Kordiimonadaceae bacterium]